MKKSFIVLFLSLCVGITAKGQNKNYLAPPTVNHFSSSSKVDTTTVSTVNKKRKTFLGIYIPPMYVEVASKKEILTASGLFVGFGGTFYLLSYFDNRHNPVPPKGTYVAAINPKHLSFSVTILKMKF